jgi:ABC-type amino acid transport substrate-binding protein
VLFSAPDVAPKVSVAAVVQYVTQTFMYDARRFPDGVAYSDIGDMTGYGIGVLRGSGIMRFLEVSRSLNLIPNNIHEGSARQLQLGRVDVWAIVDLTGMMYMRKLFPDEAAHFKFTPPFNRGDVSLACSRISDPDNAYRDRFREGLAAIKANGTYLRLMAKYYGSEDAINRDSLTEDMR